MPTIKDRQEGLAIAKELGLSLPGNSSKEKCQTAIDEELARRDAIADKVEAEADDIYLDEDESLNDDPVEQLAPEPKIEISPTEQGLNEIDIQDIKARMESEYEAKLAAKIEEIMANVETNKRVVGAPDGARKAAAMRRALKLKRVVITCRNPMKASWEGEIVVVSNDFIGTQKKYIPFGLQEGYHIPQIIFNTLKERKCTIFVNKKVNGENVKVGKQVNEFGIDVLPDLTQDEIDELAADQRARQAIDAA